MERLQWFLPPWPPALGELVLFGALLVAGLAGGELVHRLAALPRIVGYVLAGVAFGPHAADVVRSPLATDARVIVDLALGLVVFELGHRLDLDWLRRNRWLAVAALGESVGCFLAVYGALLYLGAPPPLAACAAAIGTATSPAAVTGVARELGASGQITERLLLFTAVNSAAAYVALMMVFPFLHLERTGDTATAVLHPLYLLGGAALLGFAACLAMLGIARWLGKRAERQFILLVAMVVLVVGLARAAAVPVVVAVLALGMFARNLDHGHVLPPLRLGDVMQLLYVVLFVLTGASLDFRGFGAAAAAAAALIVVRFLGKAVAILALGRLSGLRAGGGGLLSVALLPMSALAVVMVQDTAALFPRLGAELAAIVLTATAPLALLGPLATQYALKAAGEAHPEAYEKEETAWNSRAPKA
jgi:NhaP-type Na+/H+ or K+/H+ antiporter